MNIGLQNSPLRKPPIRVVFSNSAWLGIVAETYERMATETGGILLGVFGEDTWYVIESIDPGPNSIFTHSYFEYDQVYTEHVANKIRRLYKTELSLLGLWHRHPGGFDSFSGTDDSTNIRYARLHPRGAISGLVNFDPDFRFTLYHVSDPLEYNKVSFDRGDGRIPPEYLKHKEPHDFAGRIPYLGSINKESASADKVVTVPKGAEGREGVRKWIVRFLTAPLFGSKKAHGGSTSSLPAQHDTALQRFNVLDDLVKIVDEELESLLKKQDTYESIMNLEGDTIRLTLKGKSNSDVLSNSLDVVFAYDHGHGVVRTSGRQYDYTVGIVERLVTGKL